MNLLKTNALMAFAILGSCFIPESAHGCITTDLEYNVTVTATSAYDIYIGAIDYATEKAGAGTGIFDRPSSIQMREWLAIMSVGYSILSSSDGTAIEFFGRLEQTDYYRRCIPNPALSNFVEITNIIKQHALESFGYGYLRAIQYYVPEWKDVMTEYGASIGLDLEKCTSSVSSNCGSNTPSGFAKLYFDENKLIFDNDGWNANGNLTGKTNRVPYSDWRTTKFNADAGKEMCDSDWMNQYRACRVFSLAPDPGIITGDSDVCWTPIKTTFNFRQYTELWRHPHIGDTGRSYFLGDQKICDTKVEYPCYCFAKTDTEILNDAANLDELKKAESEFFNNVFKWMFEFQRKYYSATINDFDFVSTITATTSSMYEATLITYKEKMRMGIIRPRSHINKNLADETFNTYLGSETGNVGEIKGRDWIPLIPEEPTAEYPSHIVCMCEAFVQSLTTISSKYDSLSTGFNGDITIDAGSSKIELGKPSTALTIPITNLADIAFVCARARKNGGGNYDKSIDAAKSLCKPIAEEVTTIWADQITKGIAPVYIIDSTPSNLAMPETRTCIVSTSTVNEIISNYFGSQAFDALTYWFNNVVAPMLPF